MKIIATYIVYRSGESAHPLLDSNSYYEKLHEMSDGETFYSESAKGVLKKISKEFALKLINQE